MKKKLLHFVYSRFKFFTIILLTLLLTITPYTFIFSQKALASGPAVRGSLGDLWADVEVGKRDFAEISPREIVPYKLSAPGGVVVDNSVSPGRAYIWDSGNSRILGVDLGNCYNQSQPCSADIVIGQPSSTDYGACNGDSSFQTYPNKGPASNNTLCGIPEWTHTTLEDKTFASMFVDASGNLYVPDYMNNRILKFNSPFTTDVIADDVWGQTDFMGDKCNLTGDYNQVAPKPTASSLCFHAIAGDGAAVTFDQNGNMWVVDGGNNRVLRFPLISGSISKTADVVLGQPDFVSGGDYSNGSGLNQMSLPANLTFDNSGNLYVADRGNNRVLKFAPPFTSGMSGTAFITGFNDGPYTVQLDPSGNGIWTTEVVNWGSTPKLWNLNGTLNMTLSSQGNPGGGEFGIDASGNILLSVYGGGQDVYRYKKQTDGTFVKDLNLFSPPNGYNVTTANRFEHPGWTGVAVANNQLFAADGRLLFWNNPTSITNGQTPDGYVGGASFTDIPNPGFEQLKTDADGRLWAEKQSEIRVYQTPLTTGATPIKTITSPLNVLGGGQITFNAVHGIAPTSHGEYLWVSEADSHRVFRISNPLTNPIVDVVLGQTSITGNQCNRGIIPAPNTGTQLTADLTMLCFPGALSIDKLGNLYVSDHFLEADGNWRLLMFSSNTFPSNPTQVLFAPAATKEFPRKLPNDPYAYDHATFEVAFDSANRMVTGYNPYRGTRFLEYYNNPTNYNPANPSDPNYALPDGQFKDFYGWPVGMTFDSSDNLYAFDANRGRVMIYKQPFADITPPTTSITTPANNAVVKGVVSISATASDNVGVTKVEFYVDGNLLSTSTNAPYISTWDTTSLADGSQHILSTKAYDAAGNVGSSSNTTVTIDNAVPTTAITSPVNGAGVKGTVTINATASDNISVTKVEFYVDGSLLSTSTTSPYSTSWNATGLANGSLHTLYTKAYDSAGNVGTSTNVGVKIDTTAPTTSITSPTNNANVSGTVTISATASDNVGVTKVEFYVDGNLLATSTTSPYTTSWDTTTYVNNTQHNLTTKAYDSAGNVTTSAQIKVTVKDVTAPTVSITSPADGSTVTHSSVVQIAANASDVSGISKVIFYVNGSQKCSDSSAPFTCNWTVPNSIGTVYTLKATAFDKANNTSSTTITVTSN